MCGIAPIKNAKVQIVSIGCTDVVLPIECIGVEAGDLQRSCVRLVGHLMNHQPIFILSYNTDLTAEVRKDSHEHLVKDLLHNIKVMLRWIKGDPPGPPPASEKLRSCRRSPA